MNICSKCIINENYPKIIFDERSVCSICNDHQTHKPFGEEKLLAIFQNAKNKNSKYDALVPLSGGKDSTYILHLAVNVYKLKVLTMTYDNGFLSQIALANIKKSVELTKVEHVFRYSDSETQRKIYKTMLLNSGDFCGACDIATKANILKVAAEYSVPIILYGSSPLENDSFVPDSIQDIARFKYILRNSKEFSERDINNFLIYPNLNLFYLSLYKKIGKISQEVRPLFYISNPSDKEMGNIITDKLGWQNDNSREYSKHFDCIAEPLTNYIRQKIYSYERRICQYSNMIRRNEISRDKALQLYAADQINEKPANYKDILDILQISENDFANIENISPLKYETKTSKINRIFAQLIKIKQTFKKL